MKVLFILGKGRSGSTLLDLLLNRLDGWFGMGEFDRIWVKVRDGYSCGCGVPVVSCPVWGSVVRTALARHYSCDPQDLAAIRDAAATAHIAACSVLSYRELPRRLVHARSRKSAALGQHIALMSDIYALLSSRTSARVLVNSSKWPGDPALLGMVPNVEPYALHLVRDPRGVAYSWTKAKAPSDSTAGKALRQDHVVASAAGWIAKNIASELALRRLPPDRHLLVRYEDFTADPSEQLSRITRLLGESLPPDDFLERCATTRSVNHTVGGNPDRFTRGELRIVLDDRWKTEMARPSRAGVALVTSPLLHRYGYRARTRGV